MVVMQTSGCFSVCLGGLMDDSAENPVARGNQVLWEFSESESWSVHENEVTSEPDAYKECAEKPAASSIRKMHGILKLKEGNGHIISTYPLKSCLTWTKSIRLWERLTIEDLQMMEDLDVNAAIWRMFIIPLFNQKWSHENPQLDNARITRIAAAPKIQRSSCTPRWYCKRRFGVLCSIHWTRFISITNDSSKSHGYHIRLPGCAGRTADAVSAYTQVKWKML